MIIILNTEQLVFMLTHACTQRTDTPENNTKLDGRVVNISLQCYQPLLH